MGEIKRHRDRLGLSTTELAYRLGVSQSTVVRLEQSEDAYAISLGSLKRAAKALGVIFTYEFTPIAKSPSRRSSRKGKGIVRVTVESKRTPSRISQMLTDDISKQAQSRSPLERLLQACDLSDLALELRSV